MGSMLSGLCADVIISLFPLNPAVTAMATFTRLCQCSAVFNSFLSMFPTFASWRRRALGPNDRLPDPTVAALLANASCWTFGNFTGSPEAMWVNGLSGCFQAVNLVTYAWLCTSAERRGLLTRLVGALAYNIVRVGFAPDPDSVNLFQLLCTVAGVFAPFTPWIITVWPTLPTTLDRLPPWYILLFSICNGVVWFGRGLYIWNIPMAVMNVVGAFCALCLLALRYRWDEPENEDGRDDDDDPPPPPPGPGPDDGDDPPLPPAGPGSPTPSHYKEPYDAIKSDSSDNMTDTDDKTSTGTCKLSIASGSTSAQKDVAIDVVEKETGGKVSAPAAAPAAITQGAENVEIVEKDVAIDVVEEETGGNGGARNQTSPLRRSTRIRKKPARLGD